MQELVLLYEFEAQETFDEWHDVSEPQIDIVLTARSTRKVESCNVKRSDNCCAVDFCHNIGNKIESSWQRWLSPAEVVSWR